MELGAKASRRARFDVVGVGECSLDDVWLLDRRFAWGEKARAAGQVTIGGGQVATAMVAGARLGLATAYVGAIGDDDAGRAVRAGLVAEGVACDLVEHAGGRTRAALIVVDGERAERTVVELRDGNIVRGPATLPLDWLIDTRVLHTDATQLGTSLAAVRQCNAVVTLDVDEQAAGLDELLGEADLIVTSEGLPEKLTGRSRNEALAALAEATGAVVVATLGAAGCVAWDGGIVEVPSFAVHVVDSTACGDTFRAGLLCALVERQPLVPALRLANAAAALKCADIGRRGCPTRAAVDALLSGGP